jgi:hypothetical protein
MTVFCVSDGSGYPFLFTKKIEADAATQAAASAMAGTRPRSEYLEMFKKMLFRTEMNFCNRFASVVFEIKNLSFSFLIKINNP